MRRGGPLMLLASLASACSSGEGDDGNLVQRVWDGVGNLFDGLILWAGLFLLFVIVAAAALILPATWLRRRFGRPEDEPTGTRIGGPSRGPR